jgi:8-oxo-dGTP pyrophosphatase MutT (NUDIX family)
MGKLSPRPPKRVQYAALPYRFSGRSREVMLVTSRETRRWIIPKGWPQKGKAPHHSAAREAYEEAGVVGATARRPLGSFEYEKRVKHGRVVICEVYVFPLKVKRQNKKWPERREREVKWVSASRAANWIKEPMLRTIIRRLARNIRLTRNSRRMGDESETEGK